jgi:hypothetical protein
MTAELEWRRQVERWIAWVRLFAVPFAVFEVGVISSGYPPGYESWAWIITAVLAVGAAAFCFLARAELGLSAQKIVGFAALGLDAGVVSAYVVLYYSYEPDSPVRQILLAGRRSGRSLRRHQRENESPDDGGEKLGWAVDAVVESCRHRLGAEPQRPISVRLNPHEVIA